MTSAARPVAVRELSRAQDAPTGGDRPVPAGTPADLLLERFGPLCRLERERRRMPA